jgi:peptidoglycan/LPS O-acetylase OafA/YrhL
VARARLLTALGTALAALVTVGVLMARGTGALAGPPAQMIGTACAATALAAAGLALSGRRPRLGGTLVVAAAGLLLGTAAVSSGNGLGLLWLPAALLLTLGAYGLVSGFRRREHPQ